MYLNQHAFILTFKNHILLSFGFYNDEREKNIKNVRALFVKSQETQERFPGQIITKTQKN